LISEPRNLSLMNREADLALRFARPDQESRALARRVGELTYAVYGPTGVEPQSLPWIIYDASLLHLPHVKWLAKVSKQEPGPRPTLIVNDSDVAVHAINARLGRSLIPCCIGDREPGLARQTSEGPILTRELWLLIHPELKQHARIRAVIDWLQSV